VFERDGVADGARVSEWKNVAQICYHGFLETVDKTANGYDIVNDCTYAKKAGTQAVLGGNNRHVEALKQDNPHHQPLYKKNVLNGHGSAQLRARAALSCRGPRSRDPVGAVCRVWRACDASLCWQAWCGSAATTSTASTDNFSRCTRDARTTSARQRLPPRALLTSRAEKTGQTV
jgi:hypothetical protein